METVQDYRHGAYEAIGGHMTAIVSIVRNGYRTGDLQYHADAIVRLSRIVPELFPEGSGGGKTEALPVIWEEPEDFDQRMQDFSEAADNMATAATSGNMGEIGGALKSLGQACKGCHDNFRKE
ncbi:MAG: cytochrome c [Gammaproteobacteria bacterium]|nr:cytochrome c [Gammaproteobacteria bacterium]